MKKFLLRAARVKAFGPFVGFLFARLPFLLPFKKLYMSAEAVVFAHPVPSYKNHALALPRKIARDVFNLRGADFKTIFTAARAVRGSGQGYSLVINGGSRQDVAQAHFHLFDGTEPAFGNQIAIPYEKFFSAAGEGGLRGLLKEYGAGEECFSFIFEFTGGGAPEIKLSRGGRGEKNKWV